MKKTDPLYKKQVKQLKSVRARIADLVEKRERIKVRMKEMRDGTRRCRMCGEVKPLEEFYKCSRSHDNRQYNCKKCSAEYHASEDVRAKKRIRNRKQLSTEEGREKNRQRVRKWSERQKGKKNSV